MTIQIFVPEIPEFLPLIEGARKAPGCSVQEPKAGYWSILAEGELVLERRALGLGPALWNSALTGGFRGRIEEYGRDVMRIVDDE